jgi:hypothetical protein
MTQFEIDQGNSLIHNFMGKETKQMYSLGEEYTVYKKTKLKTGVPIPEDWDLLNLTEEQRKEIIEENWIYVGNSFDGLKYHGDCNWLMPVVVKCCEEISSRPGVDARGGWTPEYGYTEDIYTMRLNSSIEKVWKAVLFSINKINKINKKNETNN